MGTDTLLLVLFLGIFGGAIGYFLWTFALTRLSPTQVAVYVNLNPMIATLLGATLLAEKLTGIFIAGLRQSWEEYCLSIYVAEVSERDIARGVRIV